MKAEDGLREKIFKSSLPPQTTKTCDEFSNCGARAGEIFLNTSCLCANSQ